MLSPQAPVRTHPVMFGIRAAGVAVLVGATWLASRVATPAADRLFIGFPAVIVGAWLLLVTGLVLLLSSFRSYERGPVSWAPVAIGAVGCLLVVAVLLS